MTSVPVRLEAEAQARSPEVTLVEEETARFDEKVTAHRAAGAHEGRRDAVHCFSKAGILLGELDVDV
jgi:hypothetical protein